MLEEDEPVIVRKKQQQPTTESECNTFVMIFIGGVILLALMDTIH